jgi:hypothetical protein
MIHLTDRDAAYVQGGLAHARSKYHNCPVEVDGVRFDSKAEAARYGELKILERADEIHYLEVHPRFVILHADNYGPQVTYEGDFGYHEDGVLVVEDVKGGSATKTGLWRLKWRLAQLKHPERTFKVVER